MKFIKKSILLSLFCAGILHSAFAASDTDSTKEKTTAIQPDADNAGLKLPTGFSALIVASNVGTARHVAATPQGDLYVS